jgi:hypothetical protein
MKKICILFFILIIVQSVFAQLPDSLANDRKASFKLITGYSNLRMLDLQVSPLLYRADIVPLGIGYQALSDNCFWGVDAELLPFLALFRNVRHNQRDFIFSVINEDGVSEDVTSTLKYSSIFQQNINFWYQTRILRAKSSKNKIYLGGEFRHYFNLSFTPSAVFFMNELSLNPSITFIREIGENSSIYSGFSFPLTGLMVRLPYANDPADGEHGNFGATYAMGSNFFTPISFQRINFAFGYKTRLSKKWDIDFAYKFSWYNYPENRGITAYENKISIAFNRKLK